MAVEVKNRHVILSYRKLVRSKKRTAAVNTNHGQVYAVVACRVSAVKSMPTRFGAFVQSELVASPELYFRSRFGISRLPTGGSV